MSETERPKFGVIVLTMGNRPDDLNRGLASLLDQRGVQLDVVVVGNGWQPVGLPAGVKAHGLTENLGIPAGRNAGVSLVEGELLFFLDDDASLPADDILARMAMQFAADPTLGMIQPRVVDADGRGAPALDSARTHRRPSSEQSCDERLGGRGRDPRDAFEFAGGWPEPFWYAHEGIELAWRVWDGGFHVRYDGDIEVFHPAIQPTGTPSSTGIRHGIGSGSPGVTFRCRSVSSMCCVGRVCAAPAVAYCANRNAAGIPD